MKRIVFLLLILSILGCNQERRPEGFPKLYPCSIAILQDGLPLIDYSVMLVPLDPNNRWSTGGSAEPSGTVRPRTHGRFEGVPEGAYKLSVYKQATEGDVGSLTLSDDPEEAAEYHRRRKENPLKTFTLIDPVFSSTETTPLEVQIEPDGSNTFTFDVGKAVRKPVLSP